MTLITRISIIGDPSQHPTQTGHDPWLLPTVMALTKRVNIIGAQESQGMQAAPAVDTLGDDGESADIAAEEECRSTPLVIYIFH